MPPHHARASATAIASALDPDRVKRALASWIADEGDRTFVARCILDEGPIHHRGASYVLIALAAAIAERVGAVAASGVSDIAVPMRQSPHLDRPGHQPPCYPLRLDPSVLDLVAEGDEGARAALADAVTDGPPHHALANVALLNLLAAILRRLPPAA
ncbi:MAG: hypothetical protein H0X45_07905 [Planctomycetes bacterium]|nr:hypothetical protein [Planctomycetota bacterium]